MPPRLRCPIPGCSKVFKGQNGRTYHVRAVHQNSNRHWHPSASPETMSIGIQQPYSPPPLQASSLPQSSTETPSLQAQKSYHPYLTGTEPFHMF